MITHHTQLLNRLIEKYNFTSYCEIGIQDPANNYDKIKVAYKEGCDPEILKDRSRVFKVTSDEYFENHCKDMKFDVFFVDGLHTRGQVRKDFQNALRRLNENGFIVIHDTLPENEEGTFIPRQTKQWWGDVYKWAMDLHRYGLHYFTINCDNGCTVVIKKPIVWMNNEFRELPTNSSIDWKGYKNNGHKLLRVINPAEIESYL